MKKGLTHSYDSLFLTLLTRHIPPLLTHLLGIIKKRSTFTQLLSPLPWKYIVIYQFIFLSLIIAPGFSSQPSSVETPLLTSAIVRQKTFGLTLALLSLPLLPLLALVVYRGKNTWQKEPPKLLRFDLILLVFVLLTGISVLTSVAIGTSFLMFLQFLRAVLIYFLFSRIVLSKSDVANMPYVFLIVVIVEGFLASAQFANQSLLGIPLESMNPAQSSASQAGVAYFRAIGTLSEPNALAGYVDLILSLCIVSILSRNRLLRNIGYIATAIGIATLFFTLSRWGLIVGFFAICFTVLCCKKWCHSSFREMADRGKVLFACTSLFVAMFLVINPHAMKRFSSSIALAPAEFEQVAKQVIERGQTPLAVESALRDDKSFLGREKLLSQALYMIQRNPLGVGLGAFPYYLLNYDFTTSLILVPFLAPVHNLYLLLASELGILGLLAFLVGIAELLRLFLKYISSLGLPVKLFAVGSFASLVTFLVRSLWEVSPLGGHVMLIVWILMGLFINVVRHEALRGVRKAA